MKDMPITNYLRDLNKHRDNWKVLENDEVRIFSKDYKTMYVDKKSGTVERGYLQVELAVLKNEEKVVLNERLFGMSDYITNRVPEKALVCEQYECKLGECNVENKDIRLQP